MPGQHFTVHVIPQFHLDLAWTWRWTESLPMVEHSMVGNVAALEANPEATFAMSQIMLLDHTARYYPEVFAQIVELHKEGRWENVGGMWVESDLNIPSGESLARQFLYGQRFLLQHFGKTATTAWAPDCFGHSGNLPQIMALSGIRQYVHKRPRDINFRLPNVPFDWEGVDGTRLLCLRVVNKGRGYPSAPSQGTQFEGDATEHIQQLFAARGLQDLWGPIGVGDVGGVNSYELPPDTADMHLGFSTPEAYFAAIAKTELPDRPVVAGELNPFMDGAYTTQMACKKGNRDTENRIVHCEFMAALASHAGLPYPGETLSTLWKRFLFTQFHDVLPGTGEKATRDAAVHDFDEIALRTEELNRSSAWAICRRHSEAGTTAQSRAENSDYAGYWQAATHVASPPQPPSPLLRQTTGGDGRRGENGLGATVSNAVEAECGPNAFMHDLRGKLDLRDEVETSHPCGAEAPGVLVTNSLCATRTDVVHCVVGGQHLLDGWDAVAPDGTRTPVQGVSHRTNWSHSWQTIVFVARDMPPLGYRFYRFEPPVAPVTPHQYWGVVGHTFSGHTLRAVIDPSCGGLASVQDLQTGQEAIARDTRALFEVWEQGEYGLDYGMEYKAWWLGLTGERRRVRELSALPELVEQGDVRMRLRVRHSAGETAFTQDFIIYRDLPRLDVDVTVDFHEIEKTIRLAFPANVGPDAPFISSIPCGAIQRPQDGREYPMQAWTALCDEASGIAVLNDGRYGVSAEEGIVRMTVVRNATYPDVRSDHGEHRFRYAVVPVTTATLGRAATEAAAINRPLQGHFVHTALLKTEGVLVGLQAPDNVELSAAKVAEEGDALILRLYETVGEAAEVGIEADEVQETDILEREGKATGRMVGLRPFEVKCLRVGW